MPTSRRYSGGSIVYFQGDKGDEIYVLQSGRIIMISTALDTGEELKSDVQKGEFFGVKSSLGRYPREETAQVLGNTTVLVFTQNEFEQLVMKNTRLIMKMLRVFSKQLRDVHRQVREVLKTGAARSPSFELMNVGESFYRSGNIDHATYVFTKYLEHYPGGQYVSRAKEFIEMTRRGQSYPTGYSPLIEGSNGDIDPGMVEQGMMPAANSADDPFALNVGQSPSRRTERTIADIFYEAIDFFSKEKYGEALEKYNEVLGAKNFRDKEEAEIFSRAHYEKARTEIKINKLNDASASFSLYLKKFPTGEYVKESIFQMGLIADMKGNRDRARTLYHKVATMMPRDSITNEARKRLQKLG